MEAIGFPKSHTLTPLALRLLSQIVSRLDEEVHAEVTRYLTRRYEGDGERAKKSVITYLKKNPQYRKTRVPPPTELYSDLTVYREAFRDAIDPLTGEPLFTEKVLASFEKFMQGRRSTSTQFWLFFSPLGC